MPFDLHRVPRTDPPAGNGFRAGSARVDVTPPLGVGLAGVGPTANAAQGTFGRIQACLLLLEDDAGTRVLLATIDLFAGSRYLHEKLGIALADVGLTTDRIALCASHCHRGPSGLLGALSFDRLAGPAWVRDPHWDAPFDQPTADVLCGRLEAAVRAILGPAARTPDLVTLRPAEVALTAPRLWGWANNRSSSALDGSFANVDPDTLLWTDPAPLTHAEKLDLAERFNTAPAPSWLGSGAPPGTPAFERGDLLPVSVHPVSTKPPSGPASPPSANTIDGVLRGLLKDGKVGPVLPLLPFHHGPRRPMRPGPDDLALVDVRLHMLVAREPSGPNIGALGIFGATPTLVGSKHAITTPDAYGVGAMIARTRLADPVPVGIGGGAVGDVNLVPRNVPMDDVRTVGEDLEAAVGMVQTSGEAFAAALVDALEHASLAFTDDITLDPRYTEVTPSGLGLDPLGRQSGTSLGGSELANSPLQGIYKEGMRSKPVSPPDLQSPKADIPQLEAPGDLWPLREVRVLAGGQPFWTLLAMPHECSTALANALQVVVGQGTVPVTVASPTGEFAGYANTRLGYTAQAYEGSMNLHGRYTGDVLIEAFRGGLPVAALGPVASFSSTPGSLPLRLGGHHEPLRDKPNFMARNVRLHAGRFKSFGRHRRPQLEVIPQGNQVLVRAVVDGVPPNGDVADGPMVAVGLVDAARTRVDPFHLGVLEANDVHWPFLVWADVRKSGTIWRVQVVLPGVAGRIGLVLYGPITGGGVRFLDDQGWI
ncbi:MAG: hypothetical protein H6736_06700 [Alphaproteobacteria bacterium]|nr:hypothetical protein [Alphaproteobacteria bacterium]